MAKKPASIENYPDFTKTMNKRGYALEKLDPFALKLIHLMKSEPGGLLEVGTAYGYFPSVYSCRHVAWMVENRLV